MDASGFFLVDDDLLNFSLDNIEEEDDDDEHVKKEHSSSSSSSFCLINHQDDSDNHSRPFPPEFVEEELEWLSNKDAFPAVETCLDILSVPNDPCIGLNNHSSSSSSDNKNNRNDNGKSNDSTITSSCGGFVVPINHPVRKRSKRRRRRSATFPDMHSQLKLCLNLVTVENSKQDLALSPMNNDIGRRCLHCLAEKTPQWRAGPMGPKTLCNACGVRYKSGRLVPEYRPANSPTFSALLHSNSHRKVMEMRRQKQLPMDGMAPN